jgi:asparagine synthetase B (glutamine-hydrolysing)
MLLDAHSPPGLLRSHGLHVWENDRLAIGWRGHLYLPGHQAGPESAIALAARLETVGPEIALAELCGIFGIFVHDRHSRTWLVACDNAGLYNIFHDERQVGTSFLELAAAGGRTDSEVDPQTLVSYLAHGYIYGPGTFLPGIEKLASDELIELAPAPGGRARKRVGRKVLSVPDGDSVAIVQHHFEDLARSLRGRRLSIDLTGGLDSRLCACLYRQCGVEFETVVSAAEPDVPDVVIARRVSELLGMPFYRGGHDLSCLEDELEEVFLAGDGSFDISLLHRNRQNALDRLARGADVMSSGAGGEYFRDYYYIHDFPHYGSSKVDFDRYYRIRMMTVRPRPEYFTAQAHRLLQAACSEVRQHMEAQRAATNSESYARVSYFMKVPRSFGGFFSAYINMGLEVVAPMLDHGIVGLAMRQPPWQGFYNRWHRQVITRSNPAVAALPTAEGFTATSDLRYMLADGWSYGATQLSRVAKKVTQRALGKTLFHKVGKLAADDPSFYRRIRTTHHFADAVRRL